MNIDDKKYDYAKKSIFEGANPKINNHYPLISAIRENELEFVDWLIKNCYYNIQKKEKEYLEYEIKTVCKLYDLKGMYIYFRDLGFNLSPLNDKLENYYTFYKSTIDKDEKS
jgi:hypothetical protein